MSFKFLDGTSQATAGITRPQDLVLNITDYAVDGVTTSGGVVTGLTLKSNHVLNLLPGTVGNETYPRRPVTRTMAIKNLSYFSSTVTSLVTSTTQTFTIYPPTGYSTHNLVGFIPTMYRWAATPALDGNHDVRVTWIKNTDNNRIDLTVRTNNTNSYTGTRINGLMIFSNTFSDLI